MLLLDDLFWSNLTPNPEPNPNQVLACFSSTIFWFLVTTFSDPGILPRNTDSPGARGPAPPLYRERIDDDGAIVTDTWCASNPTLTLGDSPAAP